MYNTQSTCTCKWNDSVKSYGTKSCFNKSYRPTAFNSLHTCTCKQHWNYMYMLDENNLHVAEKKPIYKLTCFFCNGIA